MNPCRLIGCLLASALLSCVTLPKSSIQTKIISGGEVAIMEVEARYDGQSIAVYGTGFEIFPHKTCGYAEIAFVDANGRILLRKDALYKTSYLLIRSPRSDLIQDRTVSFSVDVPVPTRAVTSVFVRHHSTGGCEHSWSLQYALDWIIYKILQPDKDRARNCSPSRQIGSDREKPRALPALRSEKVDNRDFAIDTCYPTPNEIQLAEARAGKFWAKHASRYGPEPRYLAVDTSKIFPSEVKTFRRN
jgi:hypothetical protein